VAYCENCAKHVSSFFLSFFLSAPHAFPACREIEQKVEMSIDGLKLDDTMYIPRDDKLRLSAGSL
jgi:hypothetical protein